MYKKAVFAGSFDPITIGHTDIIHRAIPLFDQLIIAIGINSKKKYLFSLEQRLDFLQKVFQKEAKVEVMTYTGLTVDFCKKNNANYLLRGIRNAHDFEFEKTIAQLNRSLWSKMETICLVSTPEVSHISSTIVREILFNKGDVSQFIPPILNEDIKKYTLKNIV